MEVKLIVLNGSNAGQEVRVSKSKFFIGRAEDCQLRPRSDLISRHHCAIVVEEGYVAVRDFGSKNGTYVNGHQVRAEQELKTGDKLQVGQLSFEVNVQVPVGGQKKPKVHSVQEAAARTASAVQDDDEIDLSSWLSEDEPDSTDTKTVELGQSRDSSSSGGEGAAADSSRRPEQQETGKDKEETGPKVVGVWEKSKKKLASPSSREAAANTLKNFFRRS